MSYEAIVSPVAEFFGFDPYNAVKGRTGPRATKATFMDKVLGVTDKELETAQKEIKDYQNEKELKSTVEELGGIYNPNNSKGQTQRQIQELDPYSSLNLFKRQDEAQKEADRRYYDDRASERAERQLQREMMMLESDRNYDLKKLELNQGNARRKAELFQALFGLGSAFMI